MIDIPTLISRVQREKGTDNSLDVLIEIALFQPDDDYVAVRANAAGTKVIYTEVDGREETCWAPEWTGDRKVTAAMLKERQRINV